MKIAVCSHNMCMRATQTSLAASLAGHEVHVVTDISASQRQFQAVFNSTATFVSRDQMYQAIRNIGPDIIHFHDRPHRIALDLINANLGAPVVHDIHDMFSVMAPSLINADDSPYEADSILKASACVFVSEPNRAYAEAKYGKLPPTVVVPSGVLGRLYPPMHFPRIGSAVWGGGLYVHRPEDPRAYIDQREIVQRFASVGQAAIIYCAPTEQPEAIDQYRMSGAIMAGQETYQSMLCHYGRYDFGWYGQTTDHRQIHDTIPNKLFEYLAAGIPIVVINAREAGRFVEQHGLGVHIRRPEDIIFVRDRLEDIRLHNWQARWEFTREKLCVPLWALYDELRRSGRREPDAVRDGRPG